MQDNAQNSIEPIGENTATVPEITSLTEFMAWVQEERATCVEKCKEDVQGFFYRGHADENYTLQPSVYRTDAKGQSYRTVEYQLYQDMLRRNTAEFSDDETIFERLVRMQHYGLPTRLLDLTENPLVALYFACESSAEKNGEVFFFHHSLLNILHPSAIPEASTSGLHTWLKFQEIGRLVIAEFLSFFRGKSELTKILSEDIREFFKNFIEDLIKSIDENKSSITYLDLCNLTHILEKEAIPKFHGNCKIFLGNKKSEIINLDLAERAQAEIKILRAEIFAQELYTEFSQLCDKIISDLSKELEFKKYYEKTSLENFLRNFSYYNFIYPPLNSERIRRQQGAFLIYPPIATENYPVENFSPPVKVKIKADAKVKILKELDHLGVTRSYLFPEPMEQAEYIKNRYSARI